VVAAGPHASHLHLAPDKQPCQHLITEVLFYGQDAFLPPNQQRQSNKGNTTSAMPTAVLTE